MREHAATVGAARPLVGLFLLLLVFFVLLTAGATFDRHRSRVAADSLAAAFPVGIAGMSGERDGGGERAAAALQQRLATLFATEVAASRVQIVERGRLMQITLPVAVLFDAHGTLRVEMGPLLRQLAHELGAMRDDLSPAADLYFHQRGPVAARQLAALAAALVDHGAPPAAIRIGYEPGDAASLRLELTLRRTSPTAGSPFSGASE